MNPGPRRFPDGQTPGETAAVAGRPEPRLPVADGVHAGEVMGLLVIDIADLNVSKNTDTTLITYSLGSCIGVAIWDPVVHVGGMLHYMLPESTLSPEKAKSSPAMFCDTGIPRLFKAAYELGAQKKRLIVKIAGGSLLLDDNGTFNIGKRNYLALRKIFWKNGVMIDGEDVGGSVSRTMRLHVATGEVTIKTRNKEAAL
jgi:chemotaxis protein CheD